MALEFPAMRAGVCIIFTIIGLAMPIREAISNGAICLFDSTDIHIKNNQTAVVKVHRAFEITSEAGVRFAHVIIPINGYVEVRDVKGYTQLPGGARINLTKQDVGTSSAPAFKGFGDTQVVTFWLRTPVAGSKIYYEYKQVIKSLLYLPRITRSSGCSTDRMAVNLRWDKKIKVRYSAEGFDEFPRERGVVFVTSYLSELPDEPYSCPDNHYLAISAESFTYNKSKFSSADWADVGKFFEKLSVQPEEFQAELKTLASRLTANATTRPESLEALFDFLADSVSYVALEVGKGDFTPHICSVILNRRFGDCKDQAVLLSSLCRVAGFDAYPALVSTRPQPPVNDHQPWPAWFDHVITVVKDETGYVLLDPSDPLGSIEVLPPRLRGKMYLVCDGVSGLKTTPGQIDPASAMVWQFSMTPASDRVLNVNFSLRYLNDVARAYREFWADKSSEDAAIFLQAQLGYTGWSLSSLTMAGVDFRFDTLTVTGSFEIGLGELGPQNLAIASPLNAYLLDNIFVDTRQSSYCGANSIRLEETVAVDMSIPGLMAGSQYSDSWQRSGMAFIDEMVIDYNRAVFHRRFDFSGESLTAGDYNAFRDFLLSRIDQQYVRLQK
jgi:transglutaminase-like putative cysteine protease